MVCLGAALAWGCPDGVLCAPRSAERMALVFYLGWLSHNPSTTSGACNYPALSRRAVNNLLADCKDTRLSTRQDG